MRVTVRNVQPLGAVPAQSLTSPRGRRGLGKQGAITPIGTTGRPTAAFIHRLMEKPKDERRCTHRARPTMSLVTIPNQSTPTA